MTRDPSGGQPDIRNPGNSNTGGYLSGHDIQ
jgi:hypothetical protein